MQAGCVGILNGLKYNDAPGYLFRCARNEALEDIGRLQRPFSLKKTIFCRLLRNRKHSLKMEDMEKLDKTMHSDLRWFQNDDED